MPTFEETKRRWYPLRPHEQQQALATCDARFCAVVAGRGSGKTERAKRKLVMELDRVRRKPTSWAEPRFFYGAPTRDQAKRIAWEDFKLLVPSDWVAEVSETQLYIKTHWGAYLWVLGLDKPARAEGVQWDGIVLDESSDLKPKVFDLNLMPAMSHRNCWCWRIGVPKRHGIGAAEFKAFYQRGLQGHGDIRSFTWKSRTVLTSDQLRAARDTLDERDFLEQYEASWQTAGGQIYYSFDEGRNVRPCKIDPGRPLLVGSDFNVNPMCWVLGQFRPHGERGRLEVVDELFIRNTNTRETLDQLWGRYGEHPGGWVFYGDASGKARKTSASRSDYLQILNDERFGPARVRYPKANPPVVDRFASTNAMLCNMSGARRIHVDPRCVHLIDDLASRGYKEGTREPDDGGDRGHMADALDYLIYKRWPIRFKPVESGGEVVTT